MALTTTQVQQISDSVSQAIVDFNTCFVVNTGVSTPSATTITTGVSGTSSSQTLGRVINFLDLTPELNMLKPTNAVASNVTAYISSVRSLTSFYTQFYPLLDALDTTVVSGLNAYLVANAIQVNAWFAAAFNAYAVNAVALGYRTSPVTPLGSGTYYPNLAIDSMWNFTCGAGTTMTTSVVGTNTSTAVAGGGVGQFYIYKGNATNAAGSAVFTVTYTNAAGSPATATYTTTAGVPLASGSLAAGYLITGAIGSAITAVTGTGMTNAEQYVIGMKLLRATAY